MTKPVVTKSNDPITIGACIEAKQNSSRILRHLFVKQSDILNLT